mmetsp:Transcript_1011/g.3170  ORF Transcript_1011/g.3170 Transcript_1011/m.3170 type:complete len:101 (-) Transcript_1011:206-508(-)
MQKILIRRRRICCEHKIQTRKLSNANISLQGPKKRFLVLLLLHGYYVLGSRMMHKTRNGHIVCSSRSPSLCFWKHARFIRIFFWFVGCYQFRPAELESKK